MLSKEQLWATMKTSNGIMACNNCMYKTIESRGKVCHNNGNNECSGDPRANFQDGNFQYVKWEWDGETNLDKNGNSLDE